MFDRVLNMTVDEVTFKRLAEESGGNSEHVRKRTGKCDRENQE